MRSTADVSTSTASSEGPRPGAGHSRPDLSAPVTSARLHLRDSTRLLHEQTEAAVDLARRVETREAYARLLQSMLSLFAPLEHRLAGLPWDSSGLDLTPYLRVDLLRSDLTALGLDPSLVNDADVPHPETLAEGFGILYVLQGSALGGQVIARKAAAALQVREDVTRFFRSDGRPVGPLWRGFVHVLDAYVCTPDRLSHATAAATSTFDAFGRTVGATSFANDGTD